MVTLVVEEKQQLKVILDSITVEGEKQLVWTSTKLSGWGLRRFDNAWRFPASGSSGPFLVRHTTYCGRRLLSTCL